MAHPSCTWPRRTVGAAAPAVITLGLFAALEAPRYTYTGYGRSGSRIVKVDDDSPAAAAGLRVGDQLDSANGIPVKHIYDLEHGLTTGDSWRLAVRRSDTTLTLQLTPTGQLPIDVVRARSRSFLGLCLVGFTAWAFLAAPGAATMLLAVAGLCFGFLALGAPYVAPGIVRQALNAIATLAFAAGVVVMVHFLLAFPGRGRFLERRSALLILYAPVAAVAVPSVGNILLPPAFRVDIRLLGTLWTALSAAYVLWAFALLVQRLVATPRALRARHGLDLMLGGTLAAVVPFLIFGLAAALWPAGAGAYQAYSAFATATFSVVPLAFSVAAVRSAKHRRTSGDTRP